MTLSGCVEWPMVKSSSGTGVLEPPKVGKT
jgi:hypothetical protein